MNGPFSAEVEAAFARVMDEARRDPAFAARLENALAELRAAAQPAGSPEPAPAFDPYEPNLEVTLMQNRDEALREHLAGLSFAQLAKIVKAQRVSNVRDLFAGVQGEPASKEKIADGIIASVRNRIKSRFSAAS